MNMKTWMTAAVVAVLFASTGCRRTDIRDNYVVEIPSATEADMPAIAQALSMYAGVEKSSLRFDSAKHVLSLRYDSMQVAKKNIEMAIAGAGFKANGVTPESVGAKKADAPKK